MKRRQVEEVVTSHLQRLTDDLPQPRQRRTKVITYWPPVCMAEGCPERRDNSHLCSEHKRGMS